MEPVLWSIKYRPKSWDDFVGQNEPITQLRSYVKSKTVPHLILYGPSGTGKTTAAQIFGREILGESFTSNFKMLNIRDLRAYSLTDAKRNIQALAKIAREDRTELDEYMSVIYREAKAELKVKGQSKDPNRSQLLHQAVKLFASTYTVSDDMVKILVLDEADALDSNMLQALRRTMEVFSDVCRFILVTPSLAGWNPAIASRCVMVRFNAINAFDTEKLIADICTRESVRIDEFGMKALVRVTNGDLRRALNLLQLCAAGGKHVTEDVVFNYSDTPLSAGVRSMISLALDNKYPKARDVLRSLLTSEQYTPNEVILQIQREIASRPLNDIKMKHIMERISEIDYRMTQGKNPHIHLTALLASIGSIQEEP
ncbi:MAG: AAA family ATPase [Candidatus Thorarchaeota archaeon]